MWTDVGGRNPSMHTAVCIGRTASRLCFYSLRLAKNDGTLRIVSKGRRVESRVVLLLKRYAITSQDPVLLYIHLPLCAERTGRQQVTDDQPARREKRALLPLSMRQACLQLCSYHDSAMNLSSPKLLALGGRSQYLNVPNEVRHSWFIMSRAGLKQVLFTIPGFSGS